jgi:hypothetical protein
MTKDRKRLLEILPPLMKVKLEENVGKGEWRSEDFRDLHDELENNVHRLWEEIDFNDMDQDEIDKKEALRVIGDVANYAAMIADKLQNTA